MPRAIKPITGLFSSRTITEGRLSRGSDELLEARRAVASWAFAGGSGRPPTPRAGPVISAPPLKLTIAPGVAPARSINDAWTFTYANGTFSIGGRFVPPARPQSRAPQLRRAA